MGCHLPAEARDGQMTASASLFQFEIRQVRLNCLWFKLICFDSLLEQIIGPSWEQQPPALPFTSLQKGWHSHVPRPPMATTMSGKL